MSSHLHLHLSSCIFIVLISVKVSLSEIAISATRCDGSSFDKGSPYDDILNQTLVCLETASTQNNSRYCVRGIIYKVYGFSQCRGDVNSSECYNCLRDVGEKAAEDCNGKREARVYDDKCVLFYQGSVFSDVGFLEPIKGPECSQEKSEDPARFAAGVGSLIRETSEEAEGKEGFAVRSAWVDGFGREVFGLAQCWSVVAGESCRSCLSRATDALSGICSASIEGVVAYDCCYLRYQSYPFNSSKIGMSSLPPQNSPQPSEAPSELDVRDNSSRNSPALYFFLGGLILAVIVLALLIVWWKFIKPERLKKMASEKNRPVDYFFSGNLRTISYYDYRTLRKATNNFNPGNKLGKGGFGPVYQGILDDGRMVAVKKLALDKSQQGEPEFLAEVRLITSIQHKNLVRLLGCCSDGPQRLLVYEYMKNRSLDLIVYGQIEQYLDWQTRFQIILGIARGLQYLHEDSHLRIVHRDIKASNILLDDKFQPRIGDFGLARFFPEDQAYLSTTFAGTLGYTAPEYAIRGELSEKADIYSFGVLVLEIISCRKNTDLTLPSEMQYLPEYAWKLYEKSTVLDMVDPKLQADGFVKNDILPVFQVAFLCLQPHPSLRPPMSEVVAMLTRKSEMIPSPIKPAFLDRKHMKEHNLSWETISITFPSPLPSYSPTISRHDKPCL